MARCRRRPRPRPCENQSNDRPRQRPGRASRKIALIAHDHRKPDLVEWAQFNRETLSKHELFATGTTGQILADQLELPVNRYLSGALGGDQQVGAAIAEGRIDLVIFFSDPLAAHAHDVDVKALLRIAVLYDVPIACNRASADFMLSSPLMVSAYARHPQMPQETPTADQERKRSSGVVA